MAELREGLRRHLAAHAEQGHSLEDIGSTTEIAQQMLAVIPTASRWNDVLGPFYSGRQVTELLGGASRQAIADRRRRKTLFGLKTADGVIVYPAFQFDASEASGRRRIIAGLPEVLRCLESAAISDWTVAGWLVADQEALGGRSVIHHLRDGGDIEPVLALARNMATRFDR